MGDNDVVNGVLFYMIILGALFGIAYILTFIWVIREGHRRDFLSIGLIGTAILFSPFIAAAFVSSIKKDSDRLKIDYENKNGDIKSSSLTHWVKLKLNISTIKGLKDINDSCRFCETTFKGSEIKCTKCGKKRVWFKVKVCNLSNSRTQLLNIKELPKLTRNYKIKSIERTNTP